MFVDPSCLLRSAVFCVAAPSIKYVTLISRAPHSAAMQKFKAYTAGPRKKSLLTPVWLELNWNSILGGCWCDFVAWRAAELCWELNFLSTHLWTVLQDVNNSGPFFSLHLYITFIYNLFAVINVAFWLQWTTGGLWVILTPLYSIIKMPVVTYFQKACYMMLGMGIYIHFSCM